ncbi:hypothetical protein CQW23_34121 [Capsicum baccatum]|uniref:peptidylprolyl isomerase n=1 Tax=Capsicum baccatum TaxID=33114 RepID=A0A2G2UZU0_CAPBA|nr:hypothetical protein CQW23_34121 [Capsicum baccatum]
MIQGKGFTESTFFNTDAQLRTMDRQKPDNRAIYGDFSIGYDSDDPAFEILEGKPDGKIWKQYYKEWEESEGFDISVHPGTSFMAGIQQVHDYLSDPKIKEEYTELCKLAIADFNSKNEGDNKRYVFEEIVNVNASYAAPAGTWYYITFDDRDTTVDATAADEIKTFQSNVWHGLFDGIAEVYFTMCFFFSSPLSTLSISDKKKNKKKKKSRHNGKQEVEQDKPSLVESFDSGLVIEELSKGKPRGRKAFVGFKVAVRYTGKLMENDKIFYNNMGEGGEPFEFRLGMRVGDKRRITIPPDLRYGDQGHGGVIPPDSWLVLFLDLATYKKTRGSVAKIKIQIDLTQKRPQHVWMGYDEDDNGEGVPDYCNYCKHQGEKNYVEASTDVLKWWVFRTKETLGGDFLRAKYCQRAHPVIKKWHTSNSLSWKHMMRNKQLAETHIHWRLKSGTCSFGWDDWLGIGPLHYYGGDPMRSNNMKVNQLWIQGEWDVERLNQLLPPVIVHQIMDT